MRDQERKKGWEAHEPIQGVKNSHSRLKLLRIAENFFEIDVLKRKDVQFKTFNNVLYLNKNIEGIT